jgi:hypothetical protein
MMIHNPLKYTRPEIMENKFTEGDIVCAKEAPAIKLVVRRYVDKIYYCKIQADPTARELVYFERELISETDKSKTS